MLGYKYNPFGVSGRSTPTPVSAPSDSSEPSHRHHHGMEEPTRVHSASRMPLADPCSSGRYLSLGTMTIYGVVDFLRLWLSSKSGKQSRKRHRYRFASDIKTFLSNLSRWIDTESQANVDWIPKCNKLLFHSYVAPYLSVCVLNCDSAVHLLSAVTSSGGQFRRKPPHRTGTAPPPENVFGLGPRHNTD